MNREFNNNPHPSSPTADARDLLTRLYREIGITAVAAALEVRKPNASMRRPSVADIPAVLRKVGQAA